MLTIAREYEEEYGSRMGGAVAMCQQLMTTVPSTLKAGYTLPNALLATREAFVLNDEEYEQLQERMRNA